MAEKKRTTFLDLPPELRNHIYELSGCLQRLECSLCYRKIPGDLAEEHPSFCVARHHGTCSKELVTRVKQTSADPLDIALQCGGYISAPACFCAMPRREPPFPKQAFIVPERCETKPDAFDSFEYIVDSFRNLPKRLHACGQPSLTRVSKQVRMDTLPMFYGGLKLPFASWWRPSPRRRDKAFTFFRDIGKHNTKLLRHIVVGGRGREYEYIVSALKGYGVSEDAIVRA